MALHYLQKKPLIIELFLDSDWPEINPEDLIRANGLKWKINRK